MDEQEFYRLQFRACQRHDHINVYTAHDHFELGSEIDFDSKGNAATSINYFMSALLSAIISCIRQRLTSSQVNVFDLEAVASLCLKNPLTFLHVHGFEEPPSIESIAVKVYVYTDTDANLVIPLCKQGVENSFICNTLQKCVLLQIDYIVSL